MTGNPLFKVKDKVKFTENGDTHEGIIYNVYRWGCWIDNDHVFYDIQCTDVGNRSSAITTIYKYIREDFIIRPDDKKDADDTKPKKSVGLSKEHFVNLMNIIIEDNDKTDNLISSINETLSKYGRNYFASSAGEDLFMSSMTDSLLRWLSDVMCDDNGWIYWWIYDANYGREGEGCKVSIQDEKDEWNDMFIDSPEKLYDLLNS